MLKIVVSLISFFVFSCSGANDEDPFLSVLMKGFSYEVLGRNVAVEGMMGDLNRSWLIKLDDRYDEEKFMWGSWSQASPVVGSAELEELLLNQYGKSQNLNKINMIIQRDIPEGVLDTMRHTTVRICVIGDQKDYLFLILESD